MQPEPITNKNLFTRDWAGDERRRALRGWRAKQYTMCESLLHVLFPSSTLEQRVNWFHALHRLSQAPAKRLRAY